MPDQLLLPPSYGRSRFDAATERNRIVSLVGNADGAIRVPQDVKISRLSSDKAMTLDYTPTSKEHGVYVFVIEGEVVVNDTPLARRDSTGIWGGERIKLRTGVEDADLLIIETAP